MSAWKHIATQEIDVPVRSSGNQISNLPVLFHVYKDDLLYKAVPQCDEALMIKANLKEEILFSFKMHKAVSQKGILDANQHIVEQLGALLKEKEKVG